MIGRASNRNQKILSVFAEKSNFARKILNLEKRAKITPGHLYSEAVQKIHLAATVSLVASWNKKLSPRGG